MSQIVERPRAISNAKSHLVDVTNLSPAEEEELLALGMLSVDRKIQDHPRLFWPRSSSQSKNGPSALLTSSTKLTPTPLRPPSREG